MERKTRISTQMTHTVHIKADDVAKFLGIDPDLYSKDGVKIKVFNGNNVWDMWLAPLRSVEIVFSEPTKIEDLPLQSST